MLTPEPADVPVFVLCGGRGSRLGEIAAMRPRPMLDIGEKLMLLHIMSCYGRFGFRRFVLCTGHRGDVISSYFTNFAALNGDYTVNLASNSVSYHQRERLPDWEVTVAFTGLSTMTGARLARATDRYLDDAEHFGVTYGDGLTDADLAAELRFHLGHDRLGTVLGVQPPSQFGRLALHEDGSASFTEKPRRTTDVLNGGSSSAIRAGFMLKISRLSFELRGAPTPVPTACLAMRYQTSHFGASYQPASRVVPPIRLCAKPPRPFDAPGRQRQTSG
jgi:glucose-1-phosphate cytidylyltransferase